LLRRKRAQRRRVVEEIARLLSKRDRLQAEIDAMLEDEQQVIDSLPANGPG
jgi:hypothetical protein